MLVLTSSEAVHTGSLVTSLRFIPPLPPEHVCENFILQAAADLATACKIDFDEQADEWLKEVQPNAKKLAEHQRKKDRKEAEKALNEKKERIRKAKEAREAAAKEAAENPQVKEDFRTCYNCEV